MGYERFGWLNALGVHEKAPVLTLMVNMPPTSYSWDHLSTTCKSTEVARFQSRLWSGKLLTDLNLYHWYPKDKTQSRNEQCGQPAAAFPAPFCPLPQLSSSPVAGLYISTHWRREGGGLILKFNLLSFSHREREWGQVSKNRLACQNC